MIKWCIYLMSDQNKEYLCECGRTFNNSQAFNGHCSHCKEHLGEEKYQEAINRQIKAQIKAVESRHRQSVQFHNDEMNKWISEEHKCEKCGKVMVEKFGTGRFCSASCANTRTHSKEARIKTAKSLRKFYGNLSGTNPNADLNFDKYVEEAKELYLNGSLNYKTLSYYLLDKVEGIDFVVCPYCGMRFSHIQHKHLKQHNKTPEDLKNEFGDDYQIISKRAHENRSKSSKKTQQKLIETGNHIGWKTRKIRSYAELFWEKVLKNNNLKYESEHTVKKKNLGIEEKGCYFLDFLIDGFIDLEIDGKQHKYENRKEHDVKRDELLTKNGFIVYRISWINPVESEKVKQQIDDFLKWYQDLPKKSNIV